VSWKDLVVREPTSNLLGVNLYIIFISDIVEEVERKGRVVISLISQSGEKIPNGHSVVDNFSDHRSEKFCNSGLSLVSLLTII
jgi:hypothetical protein